MSYPAGTENDPAAIEAEIARTRASLDRKLHALENRLNPKVRVAELRERLDRGPYTGWIAAAAIATGTWMAIRGVRRYRFSRVRALDNPDLADMMGE